MRCSERVREETRRRFGITGATEQKFLECFLENPRRETDTSMPFSPMSHRRAMSYWWLSDTVDIASPIQIYSALEALEQ